MKTLILSLALVVAGCDDDFENPKPVKLVNEECRIPGVLFDGVIFESYQAFHGKHILSASTEKYHLARGRFESLDHFCAKLEALK